ncbi:phosphoglucomutase/phosphomannomutase family protein [Heliobacterium gestii]|uniref:Phosphoglucomutase n=1 Tax=Heliomicrobium gestii TaxID=2699 RepID=A0A845LHX7_HELGE|nr:phosphoglucomutase/phosphomannomutase family protein [Heliomicrobium gestii]MBM7866657.1 alpha-D-glucose phosphate-specific phosphoglucomutase [Heliomicrobium gestii]MZP43063.1 phosphoglucomutase/phosphomannomutase family protein [Heliomicrobium gestii]
MTIKFGTDGWRAIMAEEFTFGNVEIVVQAIADYVRGAGIADRGVVIGYDNRFLSDKFALRGAEVLTGNGIPVLLPTSALPTPVTAFAITHHQAAGAIMLTASHNPPEYNGIKFIPEYAGPALPDITDRIEGRVRELVSSEGPAEIKRIRLDAARAQGLVREIAPMAPYMDQLATIVDLPALQAAGLKIVIDPMWGAGIGYLEAVMERSGLAYEVIHNHRDPLFGGSLPEPSAAVLTELRRKVVESGAHLGLALDGDADRFGVIDADGAFISANQVLVLLYHHLLTHRNLTGPVARTVATTHMLDRIAARHGFTVEETPVGFKYIGESLREGETLLGGEESGGLSVRGHMPEKDGVLACALMAEVRAVAGRPLTEVLAEIDREYGRLVSQRLDLHTLPEIKAEILTRLNEYAPTHLAGVEVIKRVTIDGVKLQLADGAYALVRASGTEPLFRLYGEANSETQLREIQEQVKRDLRL